MRTAMFAGAKQGKQEMVTKEQLDGALEAWEVAREKAFREQQASATPTQSHDVLIASLRTHGHTWEQAEEEFECLSNGHRDALQSAWRDMDDKCNDYKSLLTEFKTQQ